MIRAVTARASLSLLALFLTLILGILLFRRSRRAVWLDRRLRALRGNPGKAPRTMLEALRRYESLFVGGDKDRKEIGTYLRTAGFYGQNAPAVFAFARIGTAILTIGIGYAVVIMAGVTEPRWRLAPYAAAGLVFLAAKRVVGLLASARLRRINGEMPFLLDLMLLMLESGSSLDQVFRSIGQSDSGALGESRRAMRMLIDDVGKGSPYEIALTKWGERLGVPGALELSSLFRQSLAHGVEIADALRAFNREFADRRLTSARESVGKKAAQLSAVMMMFFMPVMFILLGGMPAVQVIRALGGIAKR